MISHEEWMNKALELADNAAEIGEVPVGAVIVKDDKIVGSGYNRRETDKSSLAHAEIAAINEACDTLGGWRLAGCTMYVTLEPCPMCAGAIVNSRIDKIVFGADDPKSGCFGSVIDFNLLSFNHKPEVHSGILKDRCAAVLSNFFRELRRSKEVLF